MASRKPTTVPKPQAEKLPTRVALPGKQYALMYTKDDVPPRKERELRVALATINWGKAALLANASTIVDENGAKLDENPAFNGERAIFTEDEARQWQGLDEIAAWVFLKSWSLTTAHINGTTTTLEPVPLPEDPDAVLDLEKPVYDAITAASTKILADYVQAKDYFTVDAGAEVDDSPTGL